MPYKNTYYILYKNARTKTSHAFRFSCFMTIIFHYRQNQHARTPKNCIELLELRFAVLWDVLTHVGGVIRFGIKLRGEV